VAGTLYLVPVPIGNQADITLRALEVLRSVDLVAAEDTRHFQTLQRAHGLHVSVVSLHDQNEARRLPELIARLRDGQDIAVVSDAGTPLLSDPGYRLVRAALEESSGVVSLPGASAITTALAASGLPPLPFHFCGFPPRAAGPRQAFYRELAEDRATLVCFEAPHRLIESLRNAREALGDREACLARNLTKPHELVQRGSLEALIAGLEQERTVRGECTVVIHGADDARPAHTTVAERLARVLLEADVPPRTVSAALTEALEIPRRRAYAFAHPRQKRGAGS
jgi:16S rRNA (cytidine1402-2'-O)-methyltransferase